MKTILLLPIDPSKTKKIAVIGENATKIMAIGISSSSLKAKYEISILDSTKKRSGFQDEKQKIKPLFSYAHGLSFTIFEYLT